MAEKRLRIWYDKEGDFLEVISGALTRRAAMREFESFRDEGPRVVQAPEPTLAPSTMLPPNRVMSVTLDPEEDVAWIWTSTPEGGSYVSGYTITRRK